MTIKAELDKLSSELKAILRTTRRRHAAPNRGAHRWNRKIADRTVAAEASVGRIRNLIEGDEIERGTGI